MKVRQCRICGETKPVETHFKYKGLGTKRTYCIDCNKEWARVSKSKESNAAWMRSMRKSWNFVKGQPTPDKIIK